MNRVFLVEELVYKVDFENYQPSEEEIMRAGELLGQPTRKLDALLNRYWQVFRNYIEKKCVKVDESSICIYSWKANVPFRLFPLALHAFGTILLFKGERPEEVLAYPMNKPLSYAKSPGLPEEEYAEKMPREASLRVDGWQLTAYYNPLLNRWVFATRYVLHNMYYVKGRLVVDSLDSISNPYVILADTIAEQTGLYKKLEAYRGWTFTFVLEGPEPAITKPPYPIGADASNYRLYLLMARDPSGRLYTWSETRKILDYPSVPLVEPRKLRELHEEARRRLDVRSYFAYIDTGDPENPVIAELESDYYADAMNAKYLNDAKSAAVLVCEGFGEKLASMLSDERAQKVLEIDELRIKLESLVAKGVEVLGAEKFAELLVSTARDLGVKGLSSGEYARALKESNYKRVVKKTMAVVLEGKLLTQSETTAALAELVSRLGKALGN